MKPVGRPHKFALGDRVRINDKAPADYRERIGTISEVGPGQSEYRIEIDDGEIPTTGYLDSKCMDLIAAQG